MAGGLFKKFLSGHGQPHEASEEPARVEAAPEAEAAEMKAAEAKTEDPGFPISAGNALAKVWGRCGGEGLLFLKLFPEGPPAALCPPDFEDREFRGILNRLNLAAQQWLSQETAAAAIRSREQAAREERAKKEAAPEEPPEKDPEPAEAAPPAPLDVDELGRVLMAGNGMVAWLFLLPPSGNGRKLTKEDGMALLQEQKICAGIDQAALDQVLEERPYFKLCPVAWGTPPQEGCNGRTEDRFPHVFTRAGADDDTGAVDYRAQSSMQPINKDTAICEIVPPREGIPGLRVDGQPAPPQPVKPAAIPMGSNTVVNPEGTQLVAVCDGYLEFQGGAFNVKNLLNIASDVDYSTGNIDFQGDIQIHGNVRELFSVKASGNITVDGMVEAAKVEAGGELLVSTGVSGNAQAVLRGRVVRAKYLESCTVYATEKVESDYILTSKIFCDDAVVAAGGRGVILGSQVTASNSVKATAIGSPTERRTEITLGALPKVREELFANREELTACHAKAEELEKRAAFIHRRKDIENAAELLAPYEAQIGALEAREKELLGRQAELMEILTTLPQCRLEAGTVYPGVKLTIGTAVADIDSVRNSCVATFDQETHEIKFS